MEKNLNLNCSLNRREFVEKLAYTTFGVSVLNTPIFAEEKQSAFFGKAKHVIYIYNNGGMSHLDSFDPKGDNVMGGAKSVQTSGDFQVSEYFKELAKPYPLGTSVDCDIVQVPKELINVCHLSKV